MRESRGRAVHHAIVLGRCGTDSGTSVFRKFSPFGFFTQKSIASLRSRTFVRKRRVLGRWCVSVCVCVCVCVRACCSKDLLVFFVTAFLFSCIERYIAYILYTNLYTYKTRSSIYTDCALICTMYICGRGGSRRLYRCKFQLPLRRVSSTLFSRHRCGVTRIEWCKEPSDPSRFLSTVVRMDTFFFFFLAS